MRLISLAVLCFLMGPVSAFAQSVQPGTTWVNEGGSVLTITSVGADGAITGTYVNNVKGFDCQNEQMALNGWEEGSIISFSVRWKNANKDCNSITSWTGYHASGKIFTDWDLIYTATNTGLPTHLKGSNVYSPK